MKTWSKQRIQLLTLTLISVNLTWISLILFPTLGKPASFTFPSQPPLSNWKLTLSQPLTDQHPEDIQYLAGHTYQYTRQDSSLKIEMRYFLNTSGNISFFLKQYQQIEFPQAQPTPSQKLPIGFYQTFTHNQHAYLTTCINARGGTTILPQQFAQNRKDYDLKPDRILLWLLGQADLRDWRCLWVLMSTPLAHHSSPEVARQTLETAWLSWYEWWQPQLSQP